MTRQERIFDAIGGVDERLLSRSERTAQSHIRRWYAWGTIAVACLILSLWGIQLKSPVVEPEAPVIDENIWGEGPCIHLLSFQVPLKEPSGPRFYLYVDEEFYDACWQNGVYMIRPRNVLENMPACVMEVSHMDTMPEQAAETVREDLESRYVSVTEIKEAKDEIAWKFPDNTLYYFMARDGLAWDDAQRDTFLVDDGQDGVFVVSYGYFMEAAEGHGTRFASMAATFQVIPADHVSEWMIELDNTVEKLMQGVFSDDMKNIEDLLLPGAEVDKYDAGIADDVVIRRIDKVINHETSPTAAIVKVPYSLSLEEPGSTLVMELIYGENSNRWLAWRIGLDE